MASIRLRTLTINPPSGSLKIGDYTLSLSNYGSGVTVDHSGSLTVKAALVAIVKGAQGATTADRVLAALNSGELPKCSDSRYVFDGWTWQSGANSANTGAASYTDPLITNVPTDGVTYAIGINWKDTGGSSSTTEEGSITFDAVNGTFKDNGTRYLKYEGAVGAPLYAPSSSYINAPTGWELEGWGDYGDERIWHAPGAKMSYPSGNVTKEAKYKRTQTSTSGTITLKPDGGTLADSNYSTWWKLVNGTYQYSPPLNDNVILPSLTRTGYTFLGWKNDSTGVYTTSLSYSGGDYSFTAQWQTNTVAPSSYTVTFYANGGSGAPSAQTRTYGSTIDLSSLSKPTKTNYTLLGWSTSPTATSATYGPNGTVPVYGNMDLYAVWQYTSSSTTTDCTVTVFTNGGSFPTTASANGGTFATDRKTWTRTVAAGTVVTIPTPTNGNLTLQGFGPMGTSSATFTSTTFTVTGTVTLKAFWGEAGEAPGVPVWTIGNQEVSIGDTITFKWKPGSGGTPTSYSIYAWPNGVKDSTAILVREFVSASGQSTTYTIPRDFTSPTYYTITASNSYGVSGHSNKIKFTLKEEVDPNPPAKIMLTFNPNGYEATNMPDPNPMPVEKSSTFNLPKSKPEFYNIKEFKGWCIYATGGTTLYQPDGSFTIGTNPVTLYAIWDTVKYDVWFNPNGGLVSGSSYALKRQYVSGEAYNSNENTLRGFPDAKWDNHEFLGWYTAATGGTKVLETAKCTGTADFYAHWKDADIATPVWTSQNVKVKRGGSVKIYWRKGDYNDTRTFLYELRTSSGVALATNISATEWDYSAPTDFNGVGIQVRAYFKTTSGTTLYSDWSEVLEISLDKGAAPNTPGSCYINRYKSPPTIYTNVNSEEYSTYDVSWSSVSDVDGDFKGYKVEYCVMTGGTWSSTWRAQKDVIGQTNAQYPSAALAGFEQVKYRVAAFDELNNISAWRESAPVSISTKKPPTAPGKIIVPDQAHLPTAQQNGLIEASKEFKVSWTLSTDPDGDLAGYRLEECTNSGTWANAINTSPSVTYANRSLPWGTKTVQYRVQAYDALGLTSDWTYSEIKPVINNTAPSTPSWINIPQPVKGGEPFMITWEASTDAENNLEGYELYRSLDGGSWTLIAKPDTNFYMEEIDKTHAFHSSVAYRVRAYDNPGVGLESLFSGWCISDTFNVSNNASPKVTTSFGDGAYLGVLDEGFSFQIHVTDEENDPVDVEIAILPEGATEDAKIVLGTFVARPTPLHTVYTISDDEFQSLPMQRFTVIVTARDAEGYGRTSFSFTRRATRAFVTLKQPITYPEFIKAVKFTRLLGSFPSDCIMKVEATNNANDREGTVKWEDCTDYARSGRTYGFQNKIAWRPAFNFRITLNRGASGAGGYLSRVSGYFITDNTTQQF